MQAAARLVRTQRLSLQRPVAVRCLATATTHVGSAAAPSSTVRQSVIPLGNVEAQWANMGQEDKSLVIEQLEQLQKKDWKELSIDEKKAAYYVAFGPHGPRAPINPPGTLLKVFLGTSAMVGAAGVLFLTFRYLAAPPPKTLTREWEEASNERAREQKMNPITGITSEGYSGKGFVQHK